MTPQEIAQYVATGLHAALSPRNEIISFQGLAEKVDFNGVIEKVEEYHYQFVPDEMPTGYQNVSRHLNDVIRWFSHQLAPDYRSGVVAFLVPTGELHRELYWVWEYCNNVAVQVAIRPGYGEGGNKPICVVSVYAASLRDNLMPHQRKLIAQAEQTESHQWLMHEYPWLREPIEFRQEFQNEPPKIKLPLTEVFYQRAMQRSAELQAEADFFNTALGVPYTRPPDE